MSLLHPALRSNDDPRMPARPARPDAPDGGASLRPRSILVVDDDDSIRDMVASVLRASGYTVREAADGEAGLREAAAETPALILLDMRMPRIDGWEFARRLAESGISVPIVIMTAVRDVRGAAQSVGAVGSLPKPFGIDELLSQVARHTGSTLS